jgi:hypothetical protein
MSACTWFLAAVGLSLGAWLCAHVGMLGLLLWCWRLSSSTGRDFMHIHAHGPGPVCGKKRTTPSSPRPSIRGKEIARWGCPECPFTTRHPSACTGGVMEPAPEPLVAATATETETERDADREWEFLV